MENSQIRLRLDPWPAEYEGPLQLADLEPESSPDVDFRVESGDWKPVWPPQKIPSAALCFVDGVRRIEARVLTDSDDGFVHGLFGSWGAGCVAAFSDGDPAAPARFETLRSGRNLILGSGLRAPDEEIVCGAMRLRFEGSATPGNSPAEALGQLQYCMRDAEARLAEAVVSQGEAVCFADGPLTFFSGMARDVVGVIKRLFSPYLAAEQFRLVPNLPAGARTPLFAVEDVRLQRYSWFLRMSEARLIDHPLAGVVRLEVGAAAGLERAVELADRSAAWLPRFASDALRDPRSPQNLLPVGALERELTRRLGDPLLIRRAIEKALYQELAA